MSTIPARGPISFTAMRSVLGKSAGPVSLSDFVDHDITTHTAGALATSTLRRVRQERSMWQTLSPGARSNILGLYSVRLVNAGYTGPVLNLQRSSDNATSDFYADRKGNLRTTEGMPLQAWQGQSAEVLVKTWHDQSGGARHATAVALTGGSAPKLVLDPSGSKKYVLYFPNQSASSTSFVGLTIAAQAVAAVMCAFYPASKSNDNRDWQYLIGNNNDNSLRLVELQLRKGDGNDITNPAGSSAMHDGTYSASTPFFTTSTNAWHAIAVNRGSGTMSFTNIGYHSGWLAGRSFCGYMSDMYTFSAPLGTVATSSGTRMPDHDMLYKNMLVPSWRSALVGAFRPENWTGAQWSDASASANHAALVRGTVAAAADATYLFGDTTAGVRFPSALLPAAYTLFHVSRYNGANKRRILDGVSVNWLSGFHNGRAGVAYHGNGRSGGAPSFVGPEADYHGTSWVLSTDQNNLYRSNSANRTKADYSGGEAGQISINYGLGVGWNELSDWAVACAYMFNRTLSLAECLMIEDQLAARYCLPVPIQEGLLLSIDAQEPVTGTAVPDRSTNGYNFTLSSAGALVAGPPPFFEFSGATGYLERPSEVPLATYNTVVVVTKLSGSAGDWRTLLRGQGLTGDHQVLVQSGGNSLGMYNNKNGAQFIACDTPCDVTTLSGATTAFNTWVFRLSSVVPYFRFYYNPVSLPLSAQGTIASNANARVQTGITNVGSTGNSQFWGSIRSIAVYNRELSDEELVALCARYCGEMPNGDLIINYAPGVNGVYTMVDHVTQTQYQAYLVHGYGGDNDPWAVALACTGTGAGTNFGQANNSNSVHTASVAAPTAAAGNHIFPAFRNYKGAARTCLATHSLTTTTSAAWVAYDLVMDTTWGTKQHSFWDALENSKNFLTTGSYHQSDTHFTAPSTYSITAHYSGTRYAGDLSLDRTSTNGQPLSYFFLYGISQSFDNDASVLAFCNAPGNANAWGDDWRGTSQAGTKWSYWNSDFFTRSTEERLGGARHEKLAGFPTGEAGYSGSTSAWILVR